jgi:hypothetical protein
MSESNPRFLFSQPRALQWFENRTLVRRQDGERQAGRFELFLDLLYVAILSNFADTLAEDISGAKLVKFIVSGSHVDSRLHCCWQCHIQF